MNSRISDLVITSHILKKQEKKIKLMNYFEKYSS